MRVCSNCKSEISTCWIVDGKVLCDNCKYVSPETTVNISTPDSWINGVYENITSEPIRITGGKKELLEVCNKHGVAAKAFLKPKSQGKGYEMR